MKYRALYWLLLPCVFSGELLASALHEGDGLSMKGQTGLIMVPTAHVAQFGVMDLAQNNFLMPRYSAKTTEAVNYLFNVGAWKGLEATIRLHEVHPIGADPHAYRAFTNRDLSGNIKYQLPFQPLGWKLAVGGQDIAGLAVKEKRLYATSTYDFKPFSLTLGYANASAPASVAKNDARAIDHLQGFFWGIQYKPLDQLALMLDDDGFYRRAAARLDFGNLFNLGFDAGLQWNMHSSNPLEQHAFGFYVSVPLAANYKSVPPVESSPTYPVSLSEEMPAPVKGFALTEPEAKLAKPDMMQWVAHERWVSGTAHTDVYKLMDPQQPSTPDYQAMAVKLASVGLDNIKFGYAANPNTLVVAYENRLYGQSELAALSAALRALSKMPLLSFQSIQLVTLKESQPMLLTRVSPHWLAYHAHKETDQASKALSLSRTGALHPPQFESVSWLSDSYRNVRWSYQHGQQERVKLTVKPLLNYALGTEIGVFDYTLALQSLASTRLWSGAKALVLHQQNVANSYHFSEGGVFAGAAAPSELSAIFAQQTLNWAPGLFTTASYGRLLNEISGFDVALQESAYYMAGGRHQLHYRSGQIIDNHLSLIRPKERDFWAGRYEYFLPEYDMSVSYEYGKMYYEDMTRIVKVTSYMGDSQISVGLFDAETGAQKIIISLTVPLTPSKSYAAGPLTIAGASHWTMPLSTVTKDPANPGRNTIAGAPFGFQFYPPSTLSTDFMDRGRLTPAYMESQLSVIVKQIKTGD